MRKTNISFFILGTFLTFGLSLSLQSLLAWESPSNTPPLGNTISPIYNEGDVNNPAIMKPLGVGDNFSVVGDIYATGMDGGNNIVVIRNITSDAKTGYLLFQRAGGSFGSETGLAADRVIGTISFRPWVGGAYTETSKIVSRYTDDANTSGKGSDLRFYTTANGGSIAERLRIANDGNVGIGTVDPTAKLDVIGSIKITDGTQGANKVLTSNASGLASWQALPSMTESDPEVAMTTANKLAKWNGSALVDSTVSEVSGNVGIGVNSPSSRLQVNAATNAEGIKIVSSNYSPLNIKDSTDTTELFKVDQTGTLVKGSIPWARLSGFPTSCPSKQVVTGIGASLSCAAPTVASKCTLEDFGATRPVWCETNGFRIALEANSSCQARGYSYGIMIDASRTCTNCCHESQMDQWRLTKAYCCNY